MEKYKVGDMVEISGVKYIAIKEEEEHSCTGCALQGTCEIPYESCLTNGVIFKSIPPVKCIKLGDPHLEDNVIKVVIKEQSHRSYEFGDSSRNTKGLNSAFTASNGVTLFSTGGPLNELGCTGNHHLLAGVYIYIYARLL